MGISPSSLSTVVAISNPVAVLTTEKESPIYLIEYEMFCSFGSFSRSLSYLVDCSELNFEESFIVFISHTWIEGVNNVYRRNKHPFPDNPKNQKYNLCVNGIKKLKETLAPKANKIYVWMDFICTKPKEMNQEYKSLQKILSLCDVLFTPIVDNEDLITTEEGGDENEVFFSQYRAKAWNNGPTSYLQRSWCRLEMLLSAHTPLKTKLSHLESNESGKRLHYLYGTKELENNVDPIKLPEFSFQYLKKYDPLKGFCHHEASYDVIRHIIQSLKLYPVLRGYSGEKNYLGKRHGYGVYHYKNNDFYSGEYRNGQRAGFGVMKYHDGSCYEGEWLKDMKHGPGKFTYHNGCVATGTWATDVMDGRGHMEFIDGDKYDGEFKGLRHGVGILTSRNGDKYAGKWLHGVATGNGTLTEANGNVYSGDFLRGLKHGRGTMNYANGDVYEGNWIGGKLNLGGKMTYASGEIYRGLWFDDVREGRGVFVFANGDTYDGNFAANLPHGLGRVTSLGMVGYIYDGAWEKGYRSGYGVFRYPSGSVYEGEWASNQRHGHGKMTFANDAGVYEGNWMFGMMENLGTYQYPDGCEYVGNWSRNMRHGHGKLTYPNGVVEEGAWREDSFIRHENATLAQNIAVTFDSAKRIDSYLATASSSKAKVSI